MITNEYLQSYHTHTDILAWQESGIMSVVKQELSICYVHATSLSSIRIIPWLWCSHCKRSGAECWPEGTQTTVTNWAQWRVYVSIGEHKDWKMYTFFVRHCQVNLARCYRSWFSSEADVWLFICSICCFSVFYIVLMKSKFLTSLFLISRYRLMVCLKYLAKSSFNWDLIYIFCCLWFTCIEKLCGF